MFIAAIEDACARYAKDIEEGLDASNDDSGLESDGIDNLINESNQAEEKHVSPAFKRQRIVADSPKDRKVPAQKAGSSKAHQLLSKLLPRSNATKNVSIFLSFVFLPMLSVTY